MTSAVLFFMSRSVKTVNNLTDIICCAGTFFTTLGVVSQSSNTAPWVDVLIAAASALVFSIISILGKILTSFLEKKGLISKEHKEKIDEELEDLGDDGKLNDSNKK